MLSQVSQLFTGQLKIECPPIERCHRIGKRNGDRPHPIIIKLLDYRTKLVVLKNAFRLKGIDIHIAEDFSARVRSIRKSLWEATTSYRNNGHIVRLRYDHAFIDNVKYTWDDSTKTLINTSTTSSKSHSTVKRAGSH